MKAEILLVDDEMQKQSKDLKTRLAGHEKKSKKNENPA